MLRNSYQLIANLGWIVLYFVWQSQGYNFINGEKVSVEICKFVYGNWITRLLTEVPFIKTTFFPVTCVETKQLWLTYSFLSNWSLL